MFLIFPRFSSKSIHPSVPSFSLFHIHNLPSNKLLNSLKTNLSAKGSPQTYATSTFAFPWGQDIIFFPKPASNCGDLSSYYWHVWSCNTLNCLVTQLLRLPVSLSENKVKKSGRAMWLCGTYLL